MSKKSLGTLTVDLAVQTAGFESGMDKASRVADRETRRMERDAKVRAKAIEDAFAKMGTGILAAWGSLNMINSVKGAADFAAQMQKLSERTGVAVENLTALNYAANLNDASLSDLEQGLKGLSNKMLDAAKGSGESADAFKALGISVADAQGKLRPVDTVLLDIADAFSKMEDGAGKSALANKLMEESGLRLLPTLNKGRQGLKDLREEAEKLGVIVGPEFAAQSEEFHKNMVRLQSAGQGFAQTIADAAVPTLNELARELVAAGEKTGVFEVAAIAAKTTIETLAVTGANVAFVFSGVGREIGGIAAQLNALGHGDFKAFSTIGELMRKDAEEARRQLDDFEQRIMNPGKPTAKTGSTTPRLSAPTLKGTTPPKSGKAEYEPLADAAKAYAAILANLNKVQIAANTSGWELSAAQQQLLDVMTSPEWLQMPDTWKATITEQAEYALKVEAAANEQKRLNDLIAATPTAQLEKSRETMQFLAKAFEDGRLSADQYTEAARTALGMVEEQAADSSDKFEMVISNAFDNAGSALADFVTGGKANFGDLVSSMIKDLIKLEMQMKMHSIYKEMGGMSGLFDKIGGMLSSGSSGSSATGLASLGSSVNKSFDIPALATGTNFVPRDMFALIHEGEAVIPKQFNPAAGGLSGGMSVVINNNGTPQTVTGQREEVDSRGRRSLVLELADAMGGEAQRSGSRLNRALSSPRMISR